MSGPLEAAVQAIPERASVAVYGDAMVDEYVFGRVRRVSPEAPVPVFEPLSSRLSMGGAANVIANLDALRAHGLNLCSDARTRKTRYMVGSHQLLRVDRDVRQSPTETTLEQLCAALKQSPHNTVLLVSDYDKGWCEPPHCQRIIIAAHEDGRPVIVDPKPPQWRARYAGADLICPNEREWNAARALGQDDAAPSLVVKLGEAGADWYENRAAAGPSHPQALVGSFQASARHVFDVTGAGDTFIATLAAARSCGAGLATSIRLANLAAGHVVGEVGTAVCPHETLLRLARAADQEYPDE